MEVANVVEYTAMALGLSGAFLIGLKRRAGWLCWIFGNMLWVAFGFHIGSIGLIVQFGMFEILAIFGYYNWKKEKGAQNEDASV